MKYMLVGKSSQYTHGKWFIFISLETGRIYHRNTIDGLDIILPFTFENWEKISEKCHNRNVYTVIAEVTNTIGLQGYLISDDDGRLCYKRKRDFVDFGLKNFITNFTIVKPFMKKPFIRRNPNICVYEKTFYEMTSMIENNKESYDEICKSRL